METELSFKITNIKLSNQSIDERLNEGYIFGSANCFIYLFCSICSIVLNLPLILNWILACKKENYADFLLISIAVSDFIDGFLICPIKFIQNLIVMSIISSSLIGKNLNYIAKSFDDSIWWMSPSLLFLLSLHRFKQLISPFKEGVKLNRFRIVTIVSIWLFFPALSFLLNWYNMYIKYQEIIPILDWASELFIIISICILNILIIVHFKSKLKNTTLNKNNFRKEKKAILCTLSLTLLLLLTTGPFYIIQPFAIFKYKFVEYLHDTYDSLSYLYIIIDPLILLLFNQKLRIDLKYIFCKLNINRQNGQSSVIF